LLFLFFFQLMVARTSLIKASPTEDSTVIPIDLLIFRAKK
jgi:hypothetical protein